MYLAGGLCQQSCSPFPFLRTHTQIAFMSLWFQSLPDWVNVCTSLYLSLSQAYHFTIPHVYAHCAAHIRQFIVRLWPCDPRLRLNENIILSTGTQRRAADYAMCHKWSGVTHLKPTTAYFMASQVRFNVQPRLYHAAFFEVNFASAPFHSWIGAEL